MNMLCVLDSVTRLPKRSETRSRQLQVRRLQLENLEPRLLLTAPFPEDVPGIQVDLFATPGDNTAIAANVDANVLVVSDAYGENFAFHQATPPYSYQSAISTDDLRTATGLPGTTSRGPDGPTFAYALDDGFLLLATSDRTVDIVAQVDLNGQNLESLIEHEIFNRGDRFNYSEISRLSDGRYVLATEYGLKEFDSSGTLIGTLASGDFNGVDTLGGAIYALQGNGKLWADADFSDGINLAEIADLGVPVRDLTAGQFGDLGETLMALKADGDLVYWTQDALSSGQPGDPIALFNLRAAFKFDLNGGDIWAALTNNAMRVHQQVLYFELSTSLVEVPEGGQATVGVRLQQQPAEPVTVTVAHIAGDPDIAVSGGQIVFTPENYDHFQDVTVTAAPDDDRAIGEATLLVSGPDANDLQVTAREIEDDIGFDVQESVVEVIEGAPSGPAIRLRLWAVPADPIMVSLERVSGDTDIEVLTTEAMFDTKNWRADVYVHLNALDDLDDQDGTAEIKISAEGLQPLYVTAREYDDDRNVQIAVLQESVTVREGHTAQIQVVLTAKPNAPVDVTTRWVSGDSDLSVEAHEILSFDQSNWYKPRWVSFAAASDSDHTDGTATFEVSAAGLQPATVKVHERDRGEPESQVRYQVLVDDYRTIPLQGEQHEIDFYNRTRGDHGAVEIGGSATVNRGSVLASVNGARGAAGMWHSLHHVVSEGRSLDLGAILPEQIGPEFQYKVTAILIEVQEGHGKLKVDLKRPDLTTIWSDFEVLTGGSSVIRFDLPDDPPENIQQLVWVAEDNQAEIEVSRVLLEVAGQDHGDAEAFLWPYAQLLANFDLVSGVTRDRFSFPVGDYDAVNGIGSQAALAPVAYALGFITEEAAQRIVIKSRNALFELLENDSFNGVLPHFIELNEATGKYQIVPDTEYSIIDTLVGWGGILVGATSLGIPTASIEAAISGIDWASLTLPDGAISHGYHDTGELLSSGWRSFGTESLLVALFHAASRGFSPTINVPDPENPETDNGAGFIDHLLWMFADPIEADAWGVDWTRYRQDVIQRHVSHYDNYPVPAYGASAVEPPIPSQFPVRPDKNVAIPYDAYGVGVEGYNDGTRLFNQAVVAPHLAHMAASLAPVDFRRMWDWMVDGGFASPMNHVESLVAQQWGRDIEVHHHALKGSWNEALDALGSAGWLLGVDNSLWQASRANDFVRAGLELLGTSLPAAIVGEVFHDLDQNGVKSAEEPPLAGVTVFLDTNNNGKRDAGESSVLTGGDGSYSFTGLQPRSYAVAVERDAIWRQTSPDDLQFATPDQLSDRATFVAARDVNDDGVSDLVTLSSATDEVFVTLSGSDASARLVYFVPGRPEGADFADFDDDGDVDIAVVSYVGGALTILTNRGDGRFDIQPQIAVGKSAGAVVSGDVNGDGLADSVIANQGSFTSPGFVSLLVNQGQGVFADPVTYSAGVSPDSLVLGHFDQDGQLDLAVADGSLGRVWVFMNDGAGGFANPVAYSSVAPRDIRTDDVDLDGDLDLLVANHIVTILPSPNPPVYTNTVQIYDNLGDGTFASPVNVEVGRLPRSIDLVDLDGDGDRDLVAANGVDDTALVLLNEAGTFTHALTIGLGDVQHVRGADVDGDGDTDLIFAFGNDTPAVYRNSKGAQLVSLVSGETQAGVDFGWTISESSFVVTASSPEDCGFSFSLNHPVGLDTLNLYDVERQAFGSADVTLVGAANGPVAGSLVTTDSDRRITFVRTAGPLEPDDYMVTIRGGANGIISDAGLVLDGDRDGAAGGDFVTTFTVAAPAPITVSLPHFTRAASQSVNVPATASGIPLVLGDTTNVESLDLTLRYDPALLTVTDIARSPIIPQDDLSIDNSAPGQVQLSLLAGAPLPAGPLELVTIMAEVPQSATYKLVQILDFTSVQINGGAIRAAGQDAVHVVGYFGDASANGTYSGLDAQRIARVAVGLDAGFEAWPRVDPQIIGDITGNGSLTGFDAQKVAKKVVQLPVPEIPDIPAPSRLATHFGDPSRQNRQDATWPALTIPNLGKLPFNRHSSSGEYGFADDLYPGQRDLQDSAIVGNWLFETTSWDNHQLSGTGAATRNWHPLEQAYRSDHIGQLTTVRRELAHAPEGVPETEIRHDTLSLAILRLAEALGLPTDGGLDLTDNSTSPSFQPEVVDAFFASRNVVRPG